MAFAFETRLKEFQGIVQFFLGIERKGGVMPRPNPFHQLGHGRLSLIVKRFDPFQSHPLDGPYRRIKLILFVEAGFLFRE